MGIVKFIFYGMYAMIHNYTGDFAAFSNNIIGCIYNNNIGGVSLYRFINTIVQFYVYDG